MIQYYALKKEIITE